MTSRTVLLRGTRGHTTTRPLKRRKKGTQDGGERSSVLLARPFLWTDASGNPVPMPFSGKGGKSLASGMFEKPVPVRSLPGKFLALRLARRGGGCEFSDSPGKGGKALTANGGRG